MAFFVVLSRERSYFRFGKFANGFLQEELVVGESEVHAHRYFSAEKERRTDLTQRSRSTQRAQRRTPAGCPYRVNQRYEMCAGEIQASAARTPEFRLRTFRTAGLPYKGILPAFFSVLSACSAISVLNPFFFLFPR